MPSVRVGVAHAESVCKVCKQRSPSCINVHKIAIPQLLQPEAVNVTYQIRIGRALPAHDRLTTIRIQGNKHGMHLHGCTACLKERFESSPLHSNATVSGKTPTVGLTSWYFWRSVHSSMGGIWSERSLGRQQSVGKRLVSSM